MRQGLCSANVKLKDNVLLHGPLLPYVYLKVLSLKTKAVPLTSNTSYIAVDSCQLHSSTEVFPYLSKQLTFMEKNSTEKAFPIIIYLFSSIKHFIFNICI